MQNEDRAKATNAWSRICTAAKTLDFTPTESHTLWAVLAAIYHLGAASVTRAQLGRTTFAKPAAASRAAHCLGTTVEDLTRSVFAGSSTSQSTLNRKLRSSNAGIASDGASASLPDGIESLEGFVVGLYQEAFNALVFLDGPLNNHPAFASPRNRIRQKIQNLYAAQV